MWLYRAKQSIKIENNVKLIVAQVLIFDFDLESFNSLKKNQVVSSISNRFGIEDFVFIGYPTIILMDVIIK